MHFITYLGLFACSALAYPTDEEREAVSSWDEEAVYYGFDYEIHTAVTEDDWELTLFRITGRDGEDKVASTKPPILLQHGDAMDADIWVGGLYDGGDEDDPWMLRLVDLGYDVWMGNNRGTRYSDVNNNFPDADDYWSDYYEEQNAAKYDWTFFEMGIYDQPANVEKILEVTGAEKLTYIGYSQGTTQMFVGLSQLEESFFADRLTKAIMLAPCLWQKPESMETYRGIFPVYKERGLNTWWGEDFVEMANEICDEDEDSIACTEVYPDAGFQNNSLKAQEYWWQLATVGRFQEYIPDFETASSLISPLITPGIDSIDKVPVQFINAASDLECPIGYSERLRNEIRSTASYIFLDDKEADHGAFGSINDDAWLELIIEQIELDPVMRDRDPIVKCED